MKKVFLKSMLLLCALIVGSSSLWGEEETIASFSASGYNGGTTNNWTVNKAVYASAGGGYYKLTYSDCEIVTPSTIVWSNYTDINITITARTFGGPTAAQKKISVKSGDDELTSYSPGGTSLTPSSALSISPSSGALTIVCSGASSNVGSGVSSIVIKGTLVSGKNPSSVAFETSTPSITVPGTTTYTQAATTADGYDGTITYALSNNTCGATIDGTTVTVTKGGSVKVTANASETENFLSSSTSYTLTVNRSATITTINYTGITNTDVYTSTAAGTLTASVTAGGTPLVNPVIGWESSDDDVATINSSGVVTLVGKGSVTFTASYSETDCYAASSNTYNMTVTSSEPSQVYYLVTDEADLAAGDKVIIVSSSYDKAMSTTQNKNNRGETGIVRELDGSILIEESAPVQVFTLEGSSGAWYFNTGNNKYIYAASNSSNHLKTDTRANVGDNGKAEISFSSDDASIVFQGTNGRNDVRYNNNDGLFSCYASTSTLDAVQIYKATATINLASACTDGEGMYYGTFSCSHAFVVPSDLIVSEITVSTKGKLSITDYSTGDIVPANTGVLVSSDEDGAHQVYFSEESGSSVLGTDNMLYPGTGAVITTPASCKYYLLGFGTGENASVLGFYYGAAEGGAFKARKGGAYLAVPTSLASAPSHFAITDEENNATNIEAIEAAEEGVKFIQNGKLFIKKNGVVYDMLGTVVR